LEVKSSLVEHVWVADSTVWEMSSLSLGKVDKAGWRSHRICTGGRVVKDDTIRWRTG
jgi:hypothetical protein